MPPCLSGELLWTRLSSRQRLATDFEVRAQGRDGPLRTCLLPRQRQASGGLSSELLRIGQPCKSFVIKAKGRCLAGVCPGLGVLEHSSSLLLRVQRHGWACPV